MLMPLYAIKDSLTGFGVPFSADNDPVAIRYFGQAVKSPNSMYFNNAKDFDLYFVGNFDNKSCVFSDFESRYICSAVDFLEDK